MKKEFYTDQEAKKLRDCEVLQSDYITWSNGRKFLRRGRGTAKVLTPFKEDQWIPVTYSCGKVKVDGQVLQYIPKYSFTNPKNPFKS